jgi:hypothetical protein
MGKVKDVRSLISLGYDGCPACPIVDIRGDGLDHLKIFFSGMKI